MSRAVRRRRGDQRHLSTECGGEDEALYNSSRISKVGWRCFFPLGRFGGTTASIFSSAVLSFVTLVLFALFTLLGPSTNAAAKGTNTRAASPLSVHVNNGGSPKAAKTGMEMIQSSTSSKTRKPSGNLRQRDATMDELTVFVGIKIGAGPRGIRFSEIRSTWLEDALAEDKRLRIKFFVRADPDEGGFSDVPASEPALPVGGGHDVRLEAISLQSLLVPISCEEGRLACMTGAMFAYYLQNHANGTSPMASYFCNFDDDQYVIVSNLIDVLESYSKKLPWQGHNLYIGKSDKKEKNGKWRDSFGIKFLTGGAGYCLSRDLVERGARHFTSLPSFPDDMAVGKVVQDELGVKEPVVDERFHSHLKTDQTNVLALDDLSRQVSFGYNTKVPDSLALEKFPNIPLLFPHEEDPLRFRSLRFFLQKNASGKYPQNVQYDPGNSNSS